MSKPPKTAVAPKQSASRARSKRTTTKGGAVSAGRFLEEQRALLLAEREASLRQAESLQAEAEQLAEEMEPGDTQFDEESGEGGTLNVERERDLAMSAQARAAVDEVDRALAKVDAGTYGTCEQCGRPIPRARLKAMPAAALCVACKSGGLSRR
ncbi:MAG: TraR/DksA family transcriptional regulator [Acidimicrobiales bacterium]